MIYFIGNIEKNICKIGISDNAEVRLLTLQVEAKNKLSIFLTHESKNDDSLESALHLKYSKYNLFGEWFEYDKIDEIKHGMVYEGEFLTDRILFNQQMNFNLKKNLYDATTLVRAANDIRRASGQIDFNMSQWLNTKQSQEFTSELEVKYGKCIARINRTTWVHPLLFIDMALAISPKLKIEVYEWLFDHLLKHRNESGDSYKEMTGALYTRFNNNKEFPKFISSVADYIRGMCKVKDWQTANENQLKLRDSIHRSIKTLCVVLDDPREAVRIGINENLT